MHDGSDRDNGGFGGTEFTLKMTNGSLKKIIGPWSGRPSIWATYGAPSSMMLYINQDPSAASYSYEDIRWATKEFVDAVIDKFNLPFHTELISTSWAGHPDEEDLTLVPNKA